MNFPSEHRQAMIAAACLGLEAWVLNCAASFSFQLKELCMWHAKLRL